MNPEIQEGQFMLMMQILTFQIQLLTMEELAFMQIS